MKNALIILLGFVVLASCEDAPSGGALVFSSSSSSSSSAAAGSYAYLEIYTTLVSDGEPAEDSTLIASCEIDDGSPSGTDLDCPTFSYDEALLYNSQLTFKWGTNNTTECPFLKFYPYYYRASNSATFAPEWADAAVDCSDPENSDDWDCYNGVAPNILGTASPLLDYFFNITNISASGEATVGASSELERTSNRLTANPPSTYVIGADRTMVDDSDGIVAAFPGLYTGEMQVLRPYRVVCEDSFADPIYTLNFYLRDYDIAGPPATDNADSATFNNYPDWDSSLNTLDPQ